jgi:hypothetical protein
MLKTSIRAAFLGSATALAFTAAHAQAQTQPQPQPGGVQADPQACASLASRLANDATVEADVRNRIEQIIASGNVTQCQAVLTNWDQQGAVNQESLELVATESATQRMIVQQEVQVDAEAAVYQPPPEIGVNTGAPEILWSMPRQTVTINEPAPEISIRQGQAQVLVEVPQPRVTVMIPEPEIFISWPETTAEMSAVQPIIEVRVPEPIVTVNMPPPIVELTIGGAAPGNLVQLEDGRFAPEGTNQDDLLPRITVQQQEATVGASQEMQAPEIVLNRAQPAVTLESSDPDVQVQVVGEPEVRVVTGNQPAEQTPGAGGNAPAPRAP